MSVNIEFDRIRKVLTSIELFQDVHASSKISGQHAMQLVTDLRTSATSELSPHVAVLYNHVADGIEFYLGLKPLNV